MPTFLVFKSSKVTETLRGANPSALRTAVMKCVADSGPGGASSGNSAFGSKGYRLGAEGDKTAQRVGGGVGGGMSMGGADVLVRFVGLYFTTLFSMDAYAAAEGSPLSVQQKQKSR